MRDKWRHETDEEIKAGPVGTCCWRSPGLAWPQRALCGLGRGTRRRTNPGTGTQSWKAGLYSSPCGVPPRLELALAHSMALAIQIVAYISAADRVDAAATNAFIPYNPIPRMGGLAAQRRNCPPESVSGVIEPESPGSAYLQCEAETRCLVTGKCSNVNPTVKRPSTRESAMSISTVKSEMYRLNMPMFQHIIQPSQDLP